MLKLKIRNDGNLSDDNYENLEKEVVNMNFRETIHKEKQHIRERFLAYEEGIKYFYD
jgi:hypothetical protein